jgi:hypothetical protein
MAKSKKSADKLNTEERIGRTQIQMAIGGRESTGRKMTAEDRKKLLRAGAKNILAGRRKNQTTDSNN